MSERAIEEAERTEEDYEFQMQQEENDDSESDNN